MESSSLVDCQGSLLVAAKIDSAKIVQHFRETSRRDRDSIRRRQHLAASALYPCYLNKNTFVKSEGSDF
jgi:hypothetical protein